MPTISEYLHMLRDVEGVHGSFVVAGTGALVDSDLPAIFDSDLLGEVGARVSRLYETFFSGGGDMETCVLRYAEHKLYIRKTTWGIIAILSTVGVNLPALRMVANLVIRRIDPEIAALTANGATVSSGSTSSYAAYGATPPPGPAFSPSQAPASSAAKTLPSPASHPLSARAAGDSRASALLPSLPAHDPLPVIPEDGRDSVLPASERHVHMYRGRPVGD